MGSDRDMCVDLTKCLSDQKQLYVAKCKVWQERECTLLVNMLQAEDGMILTEYHESFKEIMQLLRVSPHLISDTSTNAGRKVASPAAAWAMSLGLEMLEDNSKIRELHDKHLKLYDVLKEEENKRVEKFLQVCKKENKAYQRHALIRKLQSLIQLCEPKHRLSSQEELDRMIKKVEEVGKVDDKHKDTLQRLPNSECSICFFKFSLQRKRACIRPCGHASTCFDCAGYEYKRTKTCPLCRGGMDQKPISLPGKLYF